MKILHAIKGLPIAAGTTTCVVEVANEMARQGHTVTVAVYCEPAPHDIALFDARVRVTSIPKILKSGDFDVVHLHALWSWDLHRVASWAHRHGIPTFWSPHGALSPWARKNRWYKKLLPWLVWQKNDMKLCAGLHATSAAEAGWLRDLGFLQPIAEVPLGTRLPDETELQPDTKTLLYVGRLHPVKGLENALRAWKLAGLGDEGWRFRLVGPDQDGYRATLESLVAELGVTSSVTFAGPIFGAELKHDYATCGALILPSFSENFGATVVDALSYGKPVIAAKGTPWAAIDGRGGWWVDNAPETLAGALRARVGLSSAARQEFARVARKLVETEYGWPVLAARLARFYGSLKTE